MTRIGGTSPPDMFAAFHPGGHDAAGVSSASRQPFSRSSASSVASISGDFAGIGQIVPPTSDDRQSPTMKIRRPTRAMEIPRIGSSLGVASRRSVYRLQLDDAGPFLAAHPAG